MLTGVNPILQFSNSNGDTNHITAHDVLTVNPTIPGIEAVIIAKLNSIVYQKFAGPFGGPAVWGGNLSAF